MTATFVDTDAVERAFSAALLADAGTWDRPPRFGLVEQHHGGRIELAEFDIPPFVWTDSGEHPHRLLLSFANVIAASPEKLTAHQLETLHRESEHTVGVWWFDEAWEAPDERVPEMVRRLRAGGSLPPLSQAPDRVESKAFNARLFGGRQLCVRLRRGEPATSTYTTTEGPVAYALAMACEAIEQRRTTP